MQYKFPIVALTLGWKGRQIDLNRNQVWDADDPFVRAHPEYFADSPAVVERVDGPLRRSVEEATARPGEKRGR